MELLDGHTLREEIQPAPDYMALPRVQLVLDGALKGLAAAHKVGIVHRDLKPENVFVADTDDGEVPKLLDFGIARVRTRDSDLTRTGSLMGTASYMAPEQVAANVGEIGPWTDVYAMGVILYEMLAGAPAFGGGTVTEVLQRVLRCEAVPLSAVRRGLSANVYALVERCMSPEPTKRPPDAETMRVALAQARLTEPGTSVPPASKTKSQNVAMAATQGSQPQQPTPAHGTVDVSGATAAASSAIPIQRKKKSVLPLILVALVVIGGGATAVVLATSGGGSAPRDAAVAIATPPKDARAPQYVQPVPIDATHVVEKTVPPPDPTDMVKIDGGTYTIGRDKPRGKELPKKAVAVDAYWIDRHEMTRAELGDKLPSESKSKAPKDPPATPARYVSWTEAKAACEALGKRLPSEAEWEIAALTTPQDPKKARLRHKGTDADLYAKDSDCSAAGLCDMLGSLSEWTADAWDGEPGKRVVRGVSYQVAHDGVLDTIHARAPLGDDERDDEVGFRCVKGAER
jgi:serine/threonine-protein kinase